MCMDSSNVCTSLYVYTIPTYLAIPNKFLLSANVRFTKLNKKNSISGHAIDIAYIFQNATFLILILLYTQHTYDACSVSK